jgi:hypothetical protein
LSSIFKIGDLVLVDNITRVYPIEIENTNNNDTVSFTLNYIVGDELETNISSNRIKVIAMNHHYDYRYLSIPCTPYLPGNQVEKAYVALVDFLGYASNLRT